MSPGVFFVSVSSWQYPNLLPSELKVTFTPLSSYLSPNSLSDTNISLGIKELPKENEVNKPGVKRVIFFLLLTEMQYPNWLHYVPFVDPCIIRQSFTINNNNNRRHHPIPPPLSPPLQILAFKSLRTGHLLFWTQGRKQNDKLRHHYKLSWRQKTRSKRFTPQTWTTRDP